MRSTECEVALTFRISSALADKLRDMARRRSLFERKAISVGSLVRAAVEKAYAGEQSPAQPAADSAGAPNQKAP
ncbi:MAG: hypothetical protein NTW87_07305 [Planctomycetota bacterium]|nr:hypothetical protein [Planctomycetota bacterium]